MTTRLASIALSIIAKEIFLIVGFGADGKIASAQE
jgi:hypothetical protein